MNFVLGHPRSGTAFCAHLLNSISTSDSTIADHEFLCNALNGTLIKKASDYYQGECSKDTILHILDYYETEPTLAVDSNWKLTWIIEPLLEKFPDAKFLHLARDPRDNIRACYNLDYYGGSIEKACSDEVLNAIAQEHFSDEKNSIFAATWAVIGYKYWYDNLPNIRTPGWEEMDAFERNCAFWSETHNQILSHLGGSDNYLAVSLDQLTDAEHVQNIFSFLELPVPDEDTITAAIHADINPQNREKQVMGRLTTHSLPAFPDWPKEKLDIFKRTCGEVAHRMGWDLS